MNKFRTAIAALALSATGLVYIAQREGYSEHAYPDPVHGTKVPTAGFGSTGGIKMGDTLPPVRALVRLRADAGEQEVALKRCFGNVALFQHEWDAFAGLAHNAGATTVCKNNARTGPSTIVQRLQACGLTVSVCGPCALGSPRHERAADRCGRADLCGHFGGQGLGVAPHL